jgi:CBS domain containing-hemolysin-like protein
MTLFALGMLVVAILLSAFFSGTETGFYRSSRVRWVLDAIEGDSISKHMLRLINNPSLYVGTSLIGNNIANYLVSLATVLLASQLSQSHYVELIAPIVISPFVFVYGESLPKNLFYLAPNRLLRKVGAPYLGLFLLFSPLVFVLWGLGRLIERIVGESPEKVRLALARQELEQVLKEGQEAGLLQPIQRKLAQNFFNIAALPIGQVCVPLHKMHSVPQGTTYRQALRYAQRFRLTKLVVHGSSRSEPKGYVRSIDLLLAAESEAVIESLHPIVTIKAQEHAGEALMRMETQRHELAQVVNERQQILGIVSLDELTAPLLARANA